MRKQHGYADFIPVIIIVAIIALLLSLLFIIAPLTCHAKWDAAGMKAVSWGPIKGCLVQLPDGRWFPEDRIREIEIPKKDAS